MGFNLKHFRPFTDTSLEMDPVVSSRSDFNQAVDDQEPAIEKFNKKLFVIGLAVLIFIISASGFIYYLWIQLAHDTNQSPGNLATVSATAAPSPAPIVIDRPSWKLEVLNGSGTAGLAKKLSDELTSLGYTVVKTGNADKNNYSTSQIKVESRVFALSNTFLADINQQLKQATISGELTDSNISAQIIIGKDYLTK